MKVLYLATTGAGDPTRASLPLHIAANGSVEAGQECAVVLAGDAVELHLKGLRRRPWGDRRRPDLAEGELDDAAGVRAHDGGVRPSGEPLI
jgi:hypothetical protein